MINLSPADWKHIQAPMAAASKQSMHAGTYLVTKFNKMAYFGVEFNSVKNILKANPETQYSCSRSMHAANGS